MIIEINLVKHNMGNHLDFHIHLKKTVNEKHFKIIKYQMKKLNKKL